MKTLKNQNNLLNSEVVANNRMNRLRGCLGGNSYRKDLSINPIEILQNKMADNETSAWLDICCGEGRALNEAAVFFANQFANEDISGKLQLIGIDLAGMFAGDRAQFKYLKLQEAAIEDFHPNQEFDLISCVHGLHYLGDKLSVIRQCAGWLKKDGIFVANLDLTNLKLTNRSNSNRLFSAFLRSNDFIFDHI